MPSPITTQTALALIQAGTAVQLLEEALPQIDLDELPEQQKRGLTASLGRLHARIHLHNQLTDTHTELPHEKA